MTKRKITKPKIDSLTPSQDVNELVDEQLTESEALEIENAHLKVQLAHSQFEAAANARAAVASRIVAAHLRQGFEPQGIDIAQRKIVMKRKVTG